MKFSLLNLLDIDQLFKIFDVLGTPQDPTLTQLCSSRVLKYLRTWPKKTKANFAAIFPRCDSVGLDLLDKLLAFNPSTRITASEGLLHSYLATYHVPDDEPDCPNLFDFSFEGATAIPDIKGIILH
jgi:mitogen-activated protein kinase 7